YQVRLEVVRGVAAETDTGDHNGSPHSGYADGLILVDDGITRRDTIAGALRWNYDEDFYQLGLLNPGNVIELDLRLPSSNNLIPFVTVVDANGDILIDEDGSLRDGHYLSTVNQTGEYYALVSAFRVYEGHLYLPTWLRGDRNWWTWSASQALAESLGGHLVTVNDEAEAAWLRATFDGNLFLGLSDHTSEGSWVWSSGEEASYRNWAGGQPYGGTYYNFSYMHSNSLWYGAAASETRMMGVIELEVEGIPASSSGPGPYGQYVLDVEVSDPVPPQVTDVTRLPDGGNTAELMSTFSLTVSEKLDPKTANSAAYNYATYNGHTYLLASSGQGWTGAETYAQSLGGHLVTIDDVDEQQFIVDTFGSQQYYLWIGLSDAAVEGDWSTWVDGTPVSYSNWVTGYPRNSSNNYAYMNTSRGAGNNLWYDYPDVSNGSWSGVIEIPGGTDTDSDGIIDVFDSHPLDPLDGFDVREAGSDEIFDTADDVIYDLWATYDGNFTIALEVLDGPLGPGHYRFTVTSGLTDVVGNGLDGNGDGVEGDAYEQYFSVNDLPPDAVFEGRGNNDQDSAAALTLVPLADSPWYLTEFVGLGSIDPANWVDSDWWSFAGESGDCVSVSVDTPDSGLDPYVVLYNSSGGSLTNDHDGGLDQDSYISGYVLPSAGTYYARVYGASATPGTYQVRLEVVRGVAAETDTGDHNGSPHSGYADGLILVDDGITRRDTIAG
ncbi:MAG: hypothetical protein GY832_04985, partial [Chloroflexi bacterium]|nr:hypothetical protein [Chloroflexota bacterium]